MQIYHYDIFSIDEGQVSSGVGQLPKMRVLVVLVVILPILQAKPYGGQPK